MSTLTFRCYISLSVEHKLCDGEGSLSLQGQSRVKVHLRYRIRPRTQTILISLRGFYGNSPASRLCLLLEIPNDILDPLQGF